MSILDLPAFEATPLQHDPYDYVVVPGFVRPEFLAELAQDYPKIDAPGSFSAAEIEPIRGTLFAFHRTASSYHGFKPCEGERRSLQMYCVTPKRAGRGGPKHTPELFRRFKRLFKRD